MTIHASRPSAWYPLAKRALDVMLSTLGLVICAPLMLALAIAIRLDSPGCAIIKQPRLGYRSRVFGCYKFRSMYESEILAPYKPLSATDARVTPVGRWLRRTSLDELPQLWNVLIGDMSLVGPRPEQVYLLDCYPSAARRRFDVKPGLTGWWQVNGRRQPIYEHVEYDLYYVDHPSFRFDVEILWRSIRAVLSGEGAV